MIHKNYIDITKRVVDSHLNLHHNLHKDLQQVWIKIFRIAIQIYQHMEGEAANESDDGVPFPIHGGDLPNVLYLPEHKDYQYTGMVLEIVDFIRIYAHY